MDSDRDGRLFDLGEDLRGALKAGESIVLDQWARRFEVEVKDVEAALRALEGLRPAPAGAPPSPIPREIEKPRLPGDYSVLGELGRGGMGVVWRVHQESLDRDVAVKVLMPGELVFGSALERFRREARSLARLRHRHIVPIHDVGECDGHVYFVMDLIEGESLAARLKREGAMNPARAVRLMRQVASAIAYVHERGLVHRDLKPANILIDADGDAYVVDFGLALDRTEAVDLTLTGHLLGTPGYMAPEQIRGDRAAVGEASDVYAMGAVLYECLSGRAPFAGLGLMELVRAVEHKEPRALTRLFPTTPPALGLVVGKAMAKAPTDRYPTARALLEDLERFEAGRMVLAEPPSVAREVRTWSRRHRTTLLAVILSALVTLLALRLGQPGSQDSVPTLVAAARRMQAAEEHASARLLLREAFDGGDALSEEELQGALLQKLLLGDGDAHECIRRATDGGAPEDLQADPEQQRDSAEWRVLQLASRHVGGESPHREALFEKAHVNDDGAGLRPLFDAMETGFRSADHSAWSAFALDLMEAPAVASVFIDWLRRQGAAGDRMLVTWLVDGPRNKASLKAPLTEHWRQQPFVDYLSERGASLMPELLPLLEHPTPGTRWAALHLACAITGLPASPWAPNSSITQPGGAPDTKEPSELGSLLFTWTEATPAEWDLEVLRWSSGAGRPASTSGWASPTWSERRLGPASLVRSLPPTADALSERMASELKLGVSFHDADGAALWEAFYRAPSSSRHALHRLLAHKLGVEAGLWPMTASGFPTREPRQLGNEWGRLIAARSGQPDMVEFSVRWAWARLIEEAPGLQITEEGEQEALAGMPFVLRATRQIESEGNTMDRTNWGLPDRLPPPTLLWQPIDPQRQLATLDFTGTVDLALGGAKLRMEGLDVESRSPNVHVWKTPESLRGIEPGETQIALQLWTATAALRRQKEVLLIRFQRGEELPDALDSGALPAGGKSPWISGDLVTRVRQRLVDKPRRKSSPAAAARKRSREAKRLTVFLVIGGFLAISIAFGVVEQIRTALRSGWKPRSIARVSSRAIMISMVVVAVIIDPRYTMSPAWVAAFLGTSSVMAWLSVPAEAPSVLPRLPSVLWFCAAALVAWSTWLDGGAVPFAWATLLWPLGAIFGGLLLELHAWRNGYFRLPIAAVIFALLAVVFGDGLVSGTILVLESSDDTVAQGVASWLTELRTHSWLSKAVSALRIGPLNLVAYHLIWWTVFPQFMKMQQAEQDRAPLQGEPGT